MQVCVKKGLKGNEWVQHLCQKMCGKGGGRSESAQASGTNIAALQELMNMAKSFAELKLGSASQNSVMFSDGLVYVKGSVSSLIVLCVASYCDNILLKEGPMLSYCINGVQFSELPAVVFAMAPAHLKGNNNPLLQAKILQWISLSDKFYTQVYPHLPINFIDRERLKNEYTRNDFIRTLQFFNSYLTNFTFLVNDRFSIADIFVFCRVLPTLQFALKNEERHTFINLMRWFKTVANQPAVQKVVGILEL